VGRGDPQGTAGLALTLEVLARRRKLQDRRFVVAQTFVPLGAEESAGIERGYRDAVYKLFSSHLYDRNNLPQVEDDTEQHFPWVIGR
jgi:hypothetical protein